MVCVFFKNGHDKNKARECFKAQDAPDRVTGLRRASKTATDGITRCFCNRRVVLTRCQHANRLLNHRPPSPGLRPIAKYAASLNAVAQAGDKTFLSLCRIGRQQERKPMHASHIFCEHYAELDAGGVRLRSVGRDRSCSWPSRLSSLLAIRRFTSANSVSLRRSVPKQLSAHVGPEFFGHVEKGIKGNLLSPLVCGISQ